MPIYEYMCQKCSQQIEAIQKFSDPPLKTHRGCGGKLSKKLSISAFQLKGGGWYADGYSPKKEEKKPEKKASDKKETGKTEKKPPEKKPNTS